MPKPAGSLGNFAGKWDAKAAGCRRHLYVFRSALDSLSPVYTEISLPAALPFGEILSV